MKTLKELEETLLKAKIQLFNQSVFIANICVGLKHRFSEQVPTAATNGIEIIYNPGFFDDLSFEEQVFLVAHESWHVAFDHFYRRGVREELRWNKAGDYVINSVLKQNGYVMPHNALHNNAYAKLATEEVYLLLPEEETDDFFIGIDVLAPPSDMSAEEHHEKIQENIVRARIRSEEAGKHHGEIPAEIKSMIDKLLNPVLPWPVLLQRFVQEFNKDDYSWTKPNRRFIPEFYLPSQHNPTIESIVVAIDTSGSISNKGFQEICTEIQNIKDTFQPRSIKVIQCDCAIQQIVEIEEHDHILDMDLLGGGGTSIKPVIEFCKDEPPTCLIYFTDLYFSVPPDPPDFPILWICTGSNPEPMPSEWGDTIYIDP